VSESEGSKELARTEPDDDLTRAEADTLWESADLSDRLDAHEKEGKSRLIRALTTTVVGPTALGLLLYFKRDVATLSAIAFLATLLVILLVAVWGWWGRFAYSDLAEVRQEADSDRLLRE
jgi:hypothetical protein